MQDPRIRRRALLGIGLAAAATSTPGCRTAAPAAWRYLTPEDARTVDAICEQLIPRDQDPGAHDAGVVNYIDTQLATRFRRYRKAYREGIAAVDTASRTKFQTPFTGLTPEQQIEILQHIEENAKPFFDLILTHTRQGFYGDPRHGGNRNRASWKMVGLAFPQVRGRQVV
jgi:gluconate 2-dehydrogenase gamma chain